MRLHLSLALSIALIFTLSNCQKTEAVTPIVVIPPGEVATLFITAVFENNDILAASALAVGDLKQKISNTSETELNQLKLITGFEVSNITVEIKESTNLSVVSMKTKMTLNGNELNGEQNLVLKLIDNQWMVYHF
ncbi:MAG: hypothetical protein HRU38_07200 [Saccharospirillaceae bacterium]|nr:hypothetical protein [Pseudomonadales bacterium]NRB78442.1 hypothetical protein [Saccharospirillaceae bacterium]